jgi:hypothetical protein
MQAIGEYHLSLIPVLMCPEDTKLNSGETGGHTVVFCSQGTVHGLFNMHAACQKTGGKHKRFNGKKIKKGDGGKPPDAARAKCNKSCVKVCTLQ